MQEVTTVVKMDDQGRIRVPVPAREALGIEGGALLEIVIRRINDKGNAEGVPVTAST